LLLRREFRPILREGQQRKKRGFVGSSAKKRSPPALKPWHSPERSHIRQIKLLSVEKGTPAGSSRDGGRRRGKKTRHMPEAEGKTLVRKENLPSSSSLRDLRRGGKKRTASLDFFLIQKKKSRPCSLKRERVVSSERLVRKLGGKKLGDRQCCSSRGRRGDRLRAEGRQAISFGGGGSSEKQRLNGRKPRWQHGESR